MVHSISKVGPNRIDDHDDLEVVVTRKPFLPNLRLAPMTLPNALYIVQFYRAGR